MDFKSLYIPLPGKFMTHENVPLILFSKGMSYFTSHGGYKQAQTSFNTFRTCTI